MCDGSGNRRVGSVMRNAHMGTTLSAGQRRALDFQQRCNTAFLNPVLADTVSQVLEVMEVRREQGVKPDQVWFFDFEVHGTLSVAEWMGF